MEISEQTILKLIEEQAATTQALADLKGSLEKSIPYIVKQHEELVKDVRSVEKKIWFFGGATAVVGHLSTHWVDKILGGK